jgi:hypothetical protein
MCFKQSLTLSLGEIHVTMDSLLASSEVAPFEHGGMLYIHFSPFNITLYSVEFIDFIDFAKSVFSMCYFKR